MSDTALSRRCWYGVAYGALIASWGAPVDSWDYDGWFVIAVLATIMASAIESRRR